MSLNDPLALALSAVMNAERVNKKELDVKPSSKLIKRVLNILQENMYLGEFNEVEDGKGNYLHINLIGKINKCGVVKPRHAVKFSDYDKFEKRFIIAKDFGILIMSTTKGIMTHKEAKGKNLGGRLLAYCY